MGKKLFAVGLVLVFLLNPSIVAAQAITTTPTVTVTKTPSRQEARDAMKNAREEAKDAMTQAREEAKEKMSEAREEFKEKLEALKDERRSAIVTGFDARITEINQTRTDQMMGHLERIQKVLDNISTKAAVLKSQGQNTATVDADIAAAQAAIDDAKQAVTDQAAKIYIVNVTTSNALKNAVSSTMRQFITDLKAVFAEVLAARTAVRKAHTDMAKLMGAKVSPTGSVTVTPSVGVSVTPTP